MYAQLIFKTGVRIVVDNLLVTLRQAYPEHEFVPLYPVNRPLESRFDQKGRKLWNHIHRIIWTQVGLALAARRAKCDVLFATCMFSPYVQPLPTVTLIFDLAIWRHPEWYPRWWRLVNYWFSQVPARWTGHITTISEDARKDIVELFGLPPEQVSSIYLGLDLPEVEAQQDRIVLDQYRIPPDARYFLYMGPAIPHKNLPALVHAFGLLVQRLPEEPLYLVIGGPARNAHGQDAHAEIHAAAMQSEVRDRLLFTGYVPREHCTILYRNALAYAFPSLFEGFGLPMIEAMACGTPVVSSDRTSLPEVGGDAALYFDPLQIESIADALFQVASKPELRAELVARGYERVRGFTWEAAAEQYLQIFETIRKR
jgi:glycosyltransferase involved in cell wall biosynthesis